MIFHVPNEIRADIKSASHIRPLKMIKAFENIGYEVDIVKGTAQERSLKIKEIKKKIELGEVYDFCYAESSTMPTLLTERHHLPTHPFLDFGFFKYLKTKGIRIGLFYRDIYWQFPLYRSNVSGIRYHLAIFMYKYDLKMYEKYLDILYLPSRAMSEYIPGGLKSRVIPLPPGTEISENELSEFKSPKLFYVGGLSGLYDITQLVQAVYNSVNAELVICCRPGEWEKQRSVYQSYLNDRIKVVHASGEELEEYYTGSNIAAMMFKPDEYLKFAIQYKLFEYLGHKKPILVSRGTASGEFVEEHDLGFVVDNDHKKITLLLDELSSNIQLLKKKTENIEKAAHINTWEARAGQVRDGLMR